MMVLLEEEEEGEESAAARRSAKRVWCATERRTHVVGGHGTSTEERGQGDLEALRARRRCGLTEISMRQRSKSGSGVRDLRVRIERAMIRPGGIREFREWVQSMGRLLLGEKKIVKSWKTF